jgi:HEAT repeat protein
MGYERFMSAERLPLGIFTTDERLIVRTWDAWLARTTGIEPAQALHRPLVEVIPEVGTRGLPAIIENVLSRGTVEVLAPALHHYLFACAPSEPSTSFDRMQQHVTIGPLREDRRIVGVVVTVEDVTARVERERSLADRLLEQRQAATMAAPGLVEAPSPQHIESLTRLLGQEDWRVRRTAVATLAQHGHAIVDALVQTLRQQHHDFNVLSSALDLLAISDIDIIEPLIGFLEDDDANLRMQAVLILGERRDRRAVPALIAHLSDPDANVRFHVIEALGRLHAVEASDALTDVAEQRDFFLAFPAIHALSRVGNSAVAPRLVPLLADEWLRAPVIEALGELGDEDVSVPLVQLLNTSEAPPDVIADALAGVYDRYESRYGAGEHIADLVRRSIAATGTQKILDAVHRVSADRLPGLAKVLGWLEGDAVQRALTRLLGQERVRSQVVEALVRYGAGVVALLIEQLKAEDLETRQAAAVALGRIGDRRATSALVAALSDPELALPAAAALARIGDRDAFEPLIGLLGARDAALRQSVIAALNSIGHPDMPWRIVALLDDPDPVVRESALKVAGYFGYPQCLGRVLACCRDDIETVRRTAVEHVAFFEDPRVFETLAHALERDAAPVRAAAASGLGRLEHPLRVDALRRALEDPDPWVRYFAVRSLGAIGDPAAVPAVLARLQQDAAAHVRLAAIDVFGRLKPAQALEILEPLTQSPNEDIARAAIGALGHVDRPDMLPVLERFLRAPEPWRRLAAIGAITVRRETRIPQVLQWVAAADEDREIVSAAVDALARIGSREDQQGAEATRALIALTAEPARRESAIAALGRLPPRRISDIAAGLHHPVTDVRRACVEALSRMKQPDASRALESALADTAASVRLTAVAELKHLGTRTSQRKLMALARTDPAAEVRHAAMRAIARTDDRGGLGSPEPR